MDNDSSCERTERVGLSYKLPIELGKEVTICQKIFLNTLGFNSNQKIASPLKKFDDPPEDFSPADKLGKFVLAYKKSDECNEKIRGRIFSCRPQIFHYRRKHASNTLYLSPKINMAGKLYENTTFPAANWVKRKMSSLSIA